MHCDLVIAIVKDMGVDLEEKDISIAHPLPTCNRDADNKLIVKFIRWAVRDKFYSNRRKVAGKKVSSLRNTKELTGVDLTKKVYL